MKKKNQLQISLEEWAEKTCFTYPGAIQYYGPASVCDAPTRTLALENDK